jgi:hypothetical protein
MTHSSQKETIETGTSHTQTYIVNGHQLEEYYTVTTSLIVQKKAFNPAVTTEMEN